MSKDNKKKNDRCYLLSVSDTCYQIWNILDSDRSGSIRYSKKYNLWVESNEEPSIFTKNLFCFVPIILNFKLNGWLGGYLEYLKRLPFPICININYNNKKIAVASQ